MGKRRGSRKKKSTNAAAATNATADAGQTPEISDQEIVGHVTKLLQTDSELKPHVSPPVYVFQVVSMLIVDVNLLFTVQTFASCSQSGWCCRVIEAIGSCASW